MGRRLTYRQIAAEIADEILREERAARSRLPSYQEMADLYDVSVTTAYRAIRILRDELRMVYGEPGRGVYVAPRRDWLYPHA